MPIQIAPLREVLASLTRLPARRRDVVVRIPIAVLMPGSELNGIRQLLRVEIADAYAFDIIFER